MIEISLEDRFSSLVSGLQLPMRWSYLITDRLSDERLALFEKTIQQHSDVIFAPTFGSPRDVFMYLRANHSRIVCFDNEMLAKRIEYIRILAGAICFNGSGDPWQVSYGTERFVFEGKIILTSRYKRDELIKKDKLRYILRDSIIV